MPFRISALPYEPFGALLALDDAALAAHRARRVVAEPGSPCRVSLADAEPGETLLLVNYQHQSTDTPFQASHAIFVRENVAAASLAVNEVPSALASRTLSLRAFDAAGNIVAAELVAGSNPAPAIDRLFADPAAAYIHAHYAAWGCYAARIDRA